MANDDLKHITYIVKSDELKKIDIPKNSLVSITGWFSIFSTDIMPHVEVYLSAPQLKKISTEVQYLLPDDKYKYWRATDPHFYFAEENISEFTAVTVDNTEKINVVVSVFPERLTHRITIKEIQEDIIEKLKTYELDTEFCNIENFKYKCIDGKPIPCKNSDTLENTEFCTTVRNKSLDYSTVEKIRELDALKLNADDVVFKLEALNTARLFKEYAEIKYIYEELTKKEEKLNQEKTEQTQEKAEEDKLENVKKEEAVEVIKKINEEDPDGVFSPELITEIEKLEKNKNVDRSHFEKKLQEILSGLQSKPYEDKEKTQKFILFSGLVLLLVLQII